jgi:tight adherence protein C
MTFLYVGVGLVVLGLLGGVLLLVSSSSGPTGVAKSLALIEQNITDRSVAKIDLPASERLIGPLFNSTRRIAVAFSPTGTVDRLNRMLDRAGNPAAWSIERIMGAKGALLLLGALLGVIGGGLSLRGILIAALLGALFFFFPDLALYNAALRRQNQTAKGLAEALDMLTVCVEAGQGFDSALLQVARNVEGPVAGEFARVLSEIQIGKSRADAFAAMGERIPLPTVKNFTSSLVQADRLGIPIASVLRQQTAAMRVARRQQAEEKAQKVTIKILFPVMFCIFPALFVVVLGPGVIRMIETLGGL